jgi:hypothetical protein
LPLRLLAVVVGVVMAFAACIQAQTKAEEYHIKAGFIFHFA